MNEKQFSDVAVTCDHTYFVMAAWGIKKNNIVYNIDQVASIIDIFLTVWEAGKSKIKMSVNLVPGKGLLLDLLMEAFCLYLHMMENVSSSLSFSSEKDADPIMEPHSHDLIYT